MAVMPCQGLPIRAPEIDRAINEISLIRGTPALHMMINRLGPGIEVPIHRDFLNPTRLGPHPCLERWHLPVTTNNLAGWWDEDIGDYVMFPGYWHGPVPYWLKHRVYNLGKRERVHLVIDLDSAISQGAYRE